MTHYSHPGAAARDPRAAEPSAPQPSNGGGFVRSRDPRASNTLGRLACQPRRGVSAVPGHPEGAA